MPANVVARSHGRYGFDRRGRDECDGDEELD
jgi:hypothetical protein